MFHQKNNPQGVSFRTNTRIASDCSTTEVENTAAGFYCDSLCIWVKYIFIFHPSSNLTTMLYTMSCARIKMFYPFLYFLIKIILLNF